MSTKIKHSGTDDPNVRRCVDLIGETARVLDKPNYYISHANPHTRSHATGTALSFRSANAHRRLNPAFTVAASVRHVPTTGRHVPRASDSDGHPMHAPHVLAHVVHPGERLVAEVAVHDVSLLVH